MIYMYPQHHVKDMLHDLDVKNNPQRHYLTKDTYTRAEAAEMCLICANNNDYNNKFNYDAFTDSFYKKEFEK